MGEQIKQTGNEMMERWHQKMPRFFYWMVVVACGIGGTAFAINQGLPMLGGTHADWWPEVYRYIISGCIGVVFACKFTVAGGYKDMDPNKILRGGELVDRDAQAPNMSDVETQQPNETENNVSDFS